MPNPKQTALTGPGSDIAIKNGCLCPSMDNDHGRGNGQVNKDGTPCFWYNGECPIHGSPPYCNTV